MYEFQRIRANLSEYTQIMNYYDQIMVKECVKVVMKPLAALNRSFDCDKRWAAKLRPLRWYRNQIHLTLTSADRLRWPGTRTSAVTQLEHLIEEALPNAPSAFMEDMEYSERLLELTQLVKALIADWIVSVKISKTASSAALTRPCQASIVSGRIIVVSAQRLLQGSFKSV